MPATPRRLNDNAIGGDLDVYSRMIRDEIPKDRIPDIGMDGRAAYILVHGELELDGNPMLNLASYVTTWMEENANKLVMESIDKNLVDKDEYPRTEVLQRRVMTMTSQMCNIPEGNEVAGTATVGSSEAIMLGLLAHKWSWRARRTAAGLPIDKPNVVYSGLVHTCWEKAAKYFDLEPRVVPVDPDRTYLHGDDIAPYVDENTVAVGAIVGNTFTGQVDDVASIDTMLQKIQKDKGWFVPIHVDGASGGFVAPFVAPEVAWDFRLEHVRSINLSNHKFGLVYAGMGTVVFRDRSDVPDELVFDITYLGGSAPTYSLNFSQSSVGTVLQYFQFLRLGRQGFEVVMKGAAENARYLEQKIEDYGHFTFLNKGSFMPVLAFKLTNPADHNHTVYDISDGLRAEGWIVPAYPLPPNGQDTDVLRIVVKDDFSRDLVDLFLESFDTVLKRLGGELGPPPAAKAAVVPRPIC
jgi:glutamate decarboxylase